jgi:glycosyltransferase involved in cell wall biosynthesis
MSHRILFLLRQSLGGMATHAADLAQGLRERGHEAEIEDASDWIPNETGPKVDKAVTKRLRERAKGFDLVHALGYRPAWACSEAFGHREAWVYTAYDMPKTTHRLLVSRLNDAQAGICPTRAVFRALDEAIAIDLTTLSPGVRPVPDRLPTKEEARKSLGLPEGFVLGGLGRIVPERGFASLIGAMGAVWANCPETILALAGDGPLRAELEELAAQTSRPEQIRFLGPLADVWPFFPALDLFVVPSTRAGFSMAALEAMAAGVPAMVRGTGGLLELVEADLSGFVFRKDDELGSHIAELLDLPLTLQTVAGAGRVRASETFALEPCVEGHIELYRSILEGD